MRAFLALVLVAGLAAVHGITDYTVEIESPNFVDEGPIGPGNVTYTFTATLNHAQTLNPADTFVFNWATIDPGCTDNVTCALGIAAPDGTTGFFPQDVNITMNAAAGTTAEMTVDIPNDNLQEEQQNFDAQLTYVSGPGAATDQASSVTFIPSTLGGTINDAEDLTISISDVTVDEGMDAVFTISVSHAYKGGLNVTWSTADGVGPNGAVAGSDYTAQTDTTSLTSTTTGEDFNVTITTLDTGAASDDLVFSLQVESTVPTLGSGAIQGTGQATINGSSEDLTIGVSTTATITEGDPTTPAVELVLTLSHAVHSGSPVIDVTYASGSVFPTTNGTTCGPADIGDPVDFVTAAGTTTFVGQAGERATITVDICDDYLAERSETFQVSTVSIGGPLIISAGGRNPVSPPGPHNFTIIDSEDPTLDVRSARLAEDDCAATSCDMIFTVAFSHGLTLGTSGFTVSWEAGEKSSLPDNSPGAAWEADRTNQAGELEGQDFIAANGNLSFAPQAGSNAKTVAITIVDDFLAEPSETFEFTIGTPSDSDFGGGISRTSDISEGVTSGTIFGADETIYAEIKPRGASDPGVTPPSGPDRVYTDEPDAGSTNIVNALIKLSHRTQNGAFVTYKTNPGVANEIDDFPAIINIDYQQIADASVEFKGPFASDCGINDGYADDNECLQMEVSATIVDDTFDEPREDFCITILPADATLNNGMFVNVSEDFQDAWIQIDRTPEDTTLTVYDAEHPETVNNSATSMVFTSVLSHCIQIKPFGNQTRAALNVSYSTFDTGSATPDVDFTTTSSFIQIDPRLASNFNPGVQINRDMTVDIIPDIVVEPPETFGVTIGFGSSIPGDFNWVTISNGNWSGDPTVGPAAIGKIIDNTTATDATISVYDATAMEGDDMLFTLALSHNTTEDITVQYRTDVSGGATATPDQDFVAINTLQDITFLADQGDNQTKTVTVETLRDELLEPDQTFRLDVMKPSGLVQLDFTIVPDTGAVGTIISDDYGTATINDGTVAEEAADITSGDVDMIFTFVLSHAADQNMEFQWNTFTGSARDTEDAITNDPQDYRPIVNKTETINSRSKTLDLTVEVVNDDVQENTETFGVSAGDFTFEVEDISTWLTWDKRNATGTITDDEDATVSIANMDLFEEPPTPGNGNSQRFLVQLSHVTAIEDTTVTYTQTALTALEGPDYSDITNPNVGTGTFQTLTPVPPIATAIQFNIVDDRLSERLRETVNVTITGTHPVYTLANANAIMSIVDNDDATVSINNHTGAETDGIFDFQLTFSHEIDVDYLVTWNTVNDDVNGQDCTLAPCQGQAWGTLTGRPQVDGDYTYSPDYILALDQDETVGAGETMRTVSVDIVDDNEAECDETFTVKVKDLTNLCVVGATCPVSTSEMYRVTIGDSGIGFINPNNEDVTIVIGDSTAVESDTMLFDVSFSHALDRQVVLLFETQDINATGRFTPVNGDLGQTFDTHRRPEQGTEQIPVDLIDDEIAQPDGYFQLKPLSFNYDGSDCLDLNSAVAEARNRDGGFGVIQDNERATVKISDLLQDENSTQFEVTITLSHSVSVDVDVSWAAIVGMDGATNGDANRFDFENDVVPSGSVTFAANGAITQTQTATVMVKDDELIELDETFTLVSTSASPDILIIDASESGDVTIINPYPGCVNITHDPVLGDDGSDFTFDMVSTHAVDVGFSVTYTAVIKTSGLPDVNPVTAIADFTGTPAGETQVGTVTVVEDEVVELEETFQVRLAFTNQQGRDMKFVNTKTDANGDFIEGIIRNDDTAIVSAADQSGVEGTNVEFIIEMDAQVDADVTFDYTTTDDTAVGNADYIPQAGQITIFANTPAPVRRSLFVRTIDNNECELDKKFNLTLSNLMSNGRNVAFANNEPTYTVVGTILDDEGTELSILPATATAPNPLSFIISSSRMCNYPIRIPVFTLEGTALAGLNYEPRSDDIVLSSNSVTTLFDVNTMVDPAHTTRLLFMASNIGEVIPNNPGASALTVIQPIAEGSIHPFVSPNFAPVVVSRACFKPLMKGVDDSTATLSMTTGPTWTQELVLDNCFYDCDGDALTYTVDQANGVTATLSAKGDQNVLTVQAANTGTQHTVVVSVADGTGGRASLTIQVTAARYPMTLPLSSFVQNGLAICDYETKDVEITNVPGNDATGCVSNGQNPSGTDCCQMLHGSLITNPVSKKTCQKIDTYVSRGRRNRAVAVATQLQAGRMSNTGGGATTVCIGSAPRADQSNCGVVTVAPHFNADVPFDVVGVAGQPIVLQVYIAGGRPSSRGEYDGYVQSFPSNGIAGYSWTATGSNTYDLVINTPNSPDSNLVKAALWISDQFYTKVYEIEINVRPMAGCSTQPPPAPMG